MRFDLSSFGPETRVAVTYLSTDAQGEAVTITTEVRGRAVHALERGLLSSPRARRDAWRGNPLCVDCGVRVGTPSESGVLTVDGQLRIAHKESCFVRAIAAEHPDLSAHVTRPRMEA